MKAVRSNEIYTTQRVYRALCALAQVQELTVDALATCWLEERLAMEYQNLLAALDQCDAEYKEFLQKQRQLIEAVLQRNES